MYVNLIKTAAGVKDLSQLHSWLSPYMTEYKGRQVIADWSRRKPRREKEVLAGGSMYWIIKNRIQARQRILGLEMVEDDEVGTYCLILLDPQIIKTDPVMKRAFQGWRYLEASSAPRDRGVYNIGNSEEEGNLTPDMERDLREAGLL